MSEVRISKILFGRKHDGAASKIQKWWKKKLFRLTKFKELKNKIN